MDQDVLDDQRSNMFSKPCDAQQWIGRDCIRIFMQKWTRERDPSGAVATKRAGTIAFAGHGLFHTLIGLCGIFVCIPLFAWQPPEEQPQGPALLPSESLTKFHVREPLLWEQLLSEPEITQPLMISFDSYGQMWLVEYRQYPEPAGIRPLSHDNFWRVVYDRMPLPPGLGGAKGKDRISIHRDSDGDGVYDHHGLFLDGLNIATSVVPAANGAWVLQPPYLLFYADEDHDGCADGTPQVHLEGFGLEDTHSVANNLCFGPDGWLYAAQGSTVSGHVRRPGESQALHSLGQCIWRYHPVTHEYELFAEGGGNAFGVAFDSEGRLFSGHNGGDTRGFFYLQGGYYRKGFTKHGSLSNPYTFGFLEPMAHPSVQRFTHTMLLLKGTNLNPERSDRMLAIDPLHGKLIDVQMHADGATFRTEDRYDAVSSEDRWFRPVGIYDGPDGSAYVCDWYDFQVAHLYAHEGQMDRDHGRVYRLRDRSAPSAESWNARLAHDAGEAGLQYLMRCLNHPYRWQRWQAVFLLARHPLGQSAVRSLRDGLLEEREFALERLWTLHLLGAIPDTIPANAGLEPSLNRQERLETADVARIANHPDPCVRAWWIRITADDHSWDRNSLSILQHRITEESDPYVLCQLAGSIKRVPSSQAMPLLEGWVQRSNGPKDSILEHFFWWDIEKHADSEELASPEFRKAIDRGNDRLVLETILPNLVRRWIMKGDDASLQKAEAWIDWIASFSSERRLIPGSNLISAVDAAMEGRSAGWLPSSLLTRLAQCGEVPLSFELRSGGLHAVDRTKKALASNARDGSLVTLIRLTGEHSHPEFLQPLIQLASDDEHPSIQIASLAALRNYPQDAVAGLLVAHWNAWSTDPLAAAASTVASRAEWTLQWIQAAEKGKVDRDRLPAEALLAMRQHDLPEIQAALLQWFPTSESLSLADVQLEAAELARRILDGHGNPYLGKRLYRNLCGRCHRLFDQGGSVGPDLTSYQRDDLPTLLRNILAPNLEIREGYRSYLALKNDGEIVVGILEKETDDQVALKGIEGESVWLHRSDLESLRPQTQSLMPEAILNPLSDQELRDLMAYLRSSQPLFDGS